MYKSTRNSFPYFLFFIYKKNIILVTHHSVPVPSVTQTPDFIYILELKVNQTATAALQQIEEKGYALPFASDPRQLFKIGINFQTDTKLIDDWKIA